MFALWQRNCGRRWLEVVEFNEFNEFGELGTIVRYSWHNLGVVILIFIAVGTVVVILSNQNELFRRQSYCSVNNNAAWISVDWTSQPVDKTAINQLAKEAASRKIRYLYPFTTYVRENDFSPSYSYATEFVSTFKQFNQETYLLAWVGIPLKRTGDIGVDGWTDLSNEVERQTIVKFVLNLVEESGFDGVHLNVETVWAENQDYLLLLDEMKEALGTEYILSVTGHTWRNEEKPIDVGDYRWHGKYYQEVSKRVDQIVVMTYDSMAENVKGIIIG